VLLSQLTDDDDDDNNDDNNKKIVRCVSDDLTIITKVSSYKYTMLLWVHR